MFRGQLEEKRPWVPLRRALIEFLCVLWRFQRLFEQFCLVHRIRMEMRRLRETLVN
jgi:hypothetical protein